MTDTLRAIHAASDALVERLEGRKPVIGIVLGSGLGMLADQIENPLVIPYSELPGFPVSTAIGHKGNFIVGTLGGKCVLVVLPIRVMIRIGIQYLFVSNAAGGTNLSFHVGDLMIIRDHINLIPNPLIGPNLDEFGPRFPDMTRPYDPGLILKAEEIAAWEGISLQKGVYVAVTGPCFSLQKGVYVAVTGPCYETPAEYRFFRNIGADAVGMSTVPEVIVARHSNIPVFGMSVITDVAHATDDEDYVTDGEAIVEAANAAADRMTVIFKRLVERL